MDLGNIGKNNGLKLSMLAIECAIALLYVFFSIVLLFTHYFDRSYLPKQLITGVGIVIGLYGLFRIYRAYVKIKERDE